MSDLEQWLTRDILSLGMAADDKRRAHAGPAVVSYVRVQTVRDDVPTDIAVHAAELRSYARPASLAAALAHVRALRAAAGDRRVAAFSMTDIESGQWGDVADVLRQLAEAGLTDVAELPVDQLTDLTASVRALVASGLPPRRVTVAEPVGDRRLDLIAQIAACRAATGWPRFFAPLPRRPQPDKPTTGYDDLRMVALSRLGLDHLDTAAAPFGIEVDWAQYGPKLAQVALTFGANHLDAVPPTGNDALGPRRTPAADVERNIRAAGFEPASDLHSA